MMHSPERPGWADLPGHRRWLAAEGDRILDFYQWACLNPAGGFDWLDDSGRPLPAAQRELWINARMVYVYALAHLAGRPGATQMVDHGLAFLAGAARDAEYGGWYWALGADGAPSDDTKQCYGHAFVLLAASTAVLAGWERARPLLDEATDVITKYFWDERAGLCADTYDRAWRHLDEYRGQNANMHLTEAYLAAAEATGDGEPLARAARIAETLIHEHAASHDWRLPEHYNADWSPRLASAMGEPDELFRPDGATVGHWFEWARLLIELDATPAARSWMRDAAAHLFERGIADGWDDTRTGLVFSVDFEGRPLNRDRYHWVIAEAIGAAMLLWRTTGEQRYETWYQRLWAFADRYLVDRVHGSWHHQLDEANRPTSTVWVGKPDAYHAYHATLMAGLDPGRGLVAGLRAGTVRSPAQAG